VMRRMCPSQWLVVLASYSPSDRQLRGVRIVSDHLPAINIELALLGELRTLT